MVMVSPEAFPVSEPTEGPQYVDHTADTSLDPKITRDHLTLVDAAYSPVQPPVIETPAQEPIVTEQLVPSRFEEGSYRTAQYSSLGSFGINGSNMYRPKRAETKNQANNSAADAIARLLELGY